MNIIMATKMINTSRSSIHIPQEHPLLVSFNLSVARSILLVCSSVLLLVSLRFYRKEHCAVAE